MLSVGFSRFEDEIMVENPKYTTRGVQGEIPDSLMLLMWQMIAAMQTSQKDYLQVFTHRSSRRIGTNLMYLVSKRQMLKCMSLMTKRTAPCC